MYSVVIMAAMVTTPDVPEFGKRGGHGCCGQMDCGGCGSSCGHHGKKHRGHGCGGHASCGCCGQQASCGGCGSECGGGCGSGCGACGGYGGGVAMPAGGGTPAPPPPAGREMPKPMGALSPTSATLVVTGAAGAKVTIGGLESSSTADTRLMVSPALDAGQSYVYDLTAEVNGVRLTQAVTVQAGVLTEVALDFAGRTVAMK